jgi:hypothetical protein
MGCRVGVSHLHALPLTAMRLDAKMSPPPGYDAKAIPALCQGLLRWAAWGCGSPPVETASRVATLRQLGCTYATEAPAVACAVL